MKYRFSLLHQSIIVLSIIQFRESLSEIPKLNLQLTLFEVTICSGIRV